jgi:spore maturation protein SpmA
MMLVRFLFVSTCMLLGLALSLTLVGLGILQFQASGDPGPMLFLALIAGFCAAISAIAYVRFLKDQ